MKKFKLDYICRDNLLFIKQCGKITDFLRCCQGDIYLKSLWC